MKSLANSKVIYMSKWNVAFYSSVYAEIWNRIIYYGLQSTLVIYFIDVLKTTEAKAYQLYGVYTALSLGTSILGGVLADKVFGYYYSVIIGSILVVIGNAIFYWGNGHTVFLSLSCIAVGVGLFKPNNSSLLGEIIQSETKKSKFFSIFYLFINIGSLLGPLIYGYSTKSFHLKSLYLLNIVGVLSTILILNMFCYRKIRTLRLKKDVQPSIFLISCILIIAVVVLSWLLLHFERFTNEITILFILVNVFLIMNITFSVPKEDRKKLKLLIVPMSSCIVYFVFLLQIYTSVMTYINQYVDRTFFGWSIPAPWFSTLEPLFLIILVPFTLLFWETMDKKKIPITETKKVIYGLLLASISFLTFSLATLIQNSTANLVFLVIANIILAISELCVIPLSISLVNSVVPYKYKSTTLAILYSSLATSGYLAGLVAKISTFNCFHGYLSYTFAFVLMGIILLFFFFLILSVDNHLHSN